MKTRRQIALAMVLVQAGVVAAIFSHAAFPIAVAVAAAAGYWLNPQLDLSRLRRRGLTAVLIVIIAVRAGMLRAEPPVLFVLPWLRMAYPIAQFFLLLQVASFFLREERGAPEAMTLYGVVVLTCAGGMFARGAGVLAFRVGALAFIALVGAYHTFGAAQRRIAAPRNATRYRALTCGFLTLALAVSSLAAALLIHYRQPLESAFMHMILGQFTPESGGISTTPRLGDMAELKGKQANIPALYVVSDTAPGYLRVRAYDKYVAGRWESTPKPAPLEPRNARPPQPAGYAYEFAWRAGDEAQWQPMDIWANMFDRGFMFHRLESAGAKLACARLDVDSNGNVSFGADRHSEIYRVFTPADAGGTLDARLADDERKRYVQLPEKIDPRVRALASRLLQDKPTTLSKALAVVGYFAKNYTYKLGIQVPDGRDPLEFFLLDKPPAHCEYFATGAIVLLRLAGVPCRYVTGFVAEERNPFGGFWIARNKDAHAWVEAYDDARGCWFIVEPTVAAGLPESNKRDAGLRSQMWDYLRFSNERRKHAFITGGMRGVWRQVGAGLASLLRKVMAPWPLGILSVCALVYIMAKHRPHRRERERAAVSPEVAELQRLLRAMDRRMKRMGLPRAASETPHRFAARIRAERPGDGTVQHAAEWYETYAAARYGWPRDETQIAALRRF